MEEAVVAANEYFSKALCPQPSALENSDGNQIESFSLLCSILLMKEKVTDTLNSLNKNLRAHFGHCSFISLLFMQNFQHADRNYVIFKCTRYLPIEGL